MEVDQKRSVSVSTMVTRGAGKTRQSLLKATSLYADSNQYNPQLYLCTNMLAASPAAAAFISTIPGHARVAERMSGANVSAATLPLILLDTYSHCSYGYREHFRQPLLRHHQLKVIIRSSQPFFGRLGALPRLRPPATIPRNPCQSSTRYWRSRLVQNGLDSAPWNSGVSSAEPMTATLRTTCRNRST